MVNEILQALRRTSEYDIKIKYNTDYPCQNGSSCCDGDYCRCGTIENAYIVENVKTWMWFSEYISLYSKDELLDHYCIERILSVFEVWSANNWEVNVCSGYYGEETNGVSLVEDIYDNVEKCLLEYQKLETMKEKIEFVLTLEYGFILDSILIAKYSVEKVNKNDIYFGQVDYHTKLKPQVVSYYEDYPLPRGIVLKGDNNRYRCIDGYHRISAGVGDFYVVVAKT